MILRPGVQALLEDARRGVFEVLVAEGLDRERRASLFEELLAMRAQAWLSGTDAAPFAALGQSARFLEMEDGRVGAVPGGAAR